MTVTSLSNTTVKLLSSLRLEKYRTEHQLFLAEGLRMAHDALKASVVPRILVSVEGTDQTEVVIALRDACLAAGGAHLVVTTEVMSKITQKENPQHVAAAYPTPRKSFDGIPQNAGRLFVALDRIRDPGNLGTIIRTAHAVNASGVLLIGPCCDPYAVESVRATTGSIFHVPLYEGPEDQFVALAQGWAGAVVGTAASAPDHYRKTSYQTPVLIVMGTEQSGLSDAIQKACHQMVHIPMHHSAESLNLSVATGVLLYGVHEALTAP